MEIETSGLPWQTGNQEPLASIKYSTQFPCVAIPAVLSPKSHAIHHQPNNINCPDPVALVPGMVDMPVVDADLEDNNNDDRVGIEDKMCRQYSPPPGIEDTRCRDLLLFKVSSGQQLDI